MTFARKPRYSRRIFVTKRGIYNSGVLKCLRSIELERDERFGATNDNRNISERIFLGVGKGSVGNDDTVSETP